ncbi:MAG: sigma-54-dependent Fis family transcriptional regulator [Gammaproteobacteria bacterium]|nr:sigma-54-dependent Fis family transcriptional regulator [Gammaproteobacteria bacterium]
MKDGQFREDLFFRVHVFPVRVPPLRERTEDLEDLIADLQESREIGRSRIEFDESATSALRAYSWPGNVRELANLIERLAIVSPNKLVRAQDLPAPYGAPSASAGSLPERAPGVKLDLKAHLSSIERELIQQALEQADGTVAHAAKLLNLQRTTLVEKLRKHRL